MNKNHFAVSNAAPTAFITQCKKRVKQYSDTVYLNNQDTFEIELFNPLTTRVLAKIHLNEKLINSSGIIINPGQRVFLERYIDTNHKFLFETYNVSGKQAMEAIQHNGHVKVEFYAELPVTPLWTSNTYYCGTLPTWNSTAGNSIGTFTTNGYGSYNGTLTCTSDGVNFSGGYVNPTSLLCDSVKVETGIIGKGSASDQQFVTVNADFNYIPFETVEWKILPLSTKPVETSDLKLYCSNCGTRRKKDNHLYCYRCGNKF